MRRLFWLSLGAAAGYYAARKVPQVVEQTRERGLVGNASLAASTASRVASSTRAAFTTPAPRSPAADATDTAARPSSTDGPSTAPREGRS